MHTFSKLLSICAGALFAASLVLGFLGADSTERPATIPLLDASVICLVASLIILLVRLRCAITERRHPDE